MKRLKKAFALLMAGSMWAGCIPVQAAGLTVETDTRGSGVVYDIDDGLILDFDMESMTENTVINKEDSTAFKVEGNSPVLAESREGHGQALQFDGSTNYINLGTDYQIPDNKATIAAWVKIDTDPNGLSRIICRSRTTILNENDIALYVRNNGKLEAGCPVWIASEENVVSFGEWQHIAVTTDGTTEKLYVNGEMVTSGAAGNIEDDWQKAGLLIGAGWNAEGTAPFADHMFKGAMDELKVYTRDLSQSEIKVLADAEDTGGEEETDPAELPEAVYEFTMNEVLDGTGDLEGQKVITNNVDGTEYPIYGNYRVDDFGIYDKSIEFDGSSTYVNIGKPDIHREYTFSAWTNIDSATQTQSRLNKIFGRDRTTITNADAMYFTVRGTGNIEFSANQRTDSGTLGGWVPSGEGIYEFNNWNHVAVTGDGETVKIYYNGELIISESANGGPDLSANPLDMLIGAGYNAEGTDIFPGHAFNGRLDDVRINDQALTQEQIQESLKGIEIPPEAGAVSPAEGELIDAAGQLKVEFNMPDPVVTDGSGQEIPVDFKLLDEDGVEGTEVLLITPAFKLKVGGTYTYTIPKNVVINEKGAGNPEKSYTYVVRQSLDGDAENSDLDYWVSKDISEPSEIIEEGGMVTIANGLVERTFDLNQNFLTTSYKNLYTGISLLNNDNLQADILFSLNEEYVDGDTSTDMQFDIGGTDETIPTFQYDSYTIEDKTEEIFHWEYDPLISPLSMKDADWPAEGKALVVNFIAPDNADSKYEGVQVQVRYEIYDGIPVICKKINVTNTGNSDVIVHRMTVEALPVNTAVKDALYMEGSMNAGDNHDRNNGRLSYINWNSKNADHGVLTHQYARPDGSTRSYGPNYRLSPDESFTSYRLYELFYSSGYFEWQTMEMKKMYRVLFPQTLDAPLIYHCISSDTTTVKRAVDEAANAGFNMVLLSFGSGVNTEDTSEANIAKYKELVDYAHSKDILLGAYMMQVARGDGSSDDIYSGGWGSMRCLTADAAKTTQENVLKFIDGTGLDCLEVDGIYPGAACTLDHADKEHRHEGLEDSIVKQWEYGVDEFYRELRERNVYINSPDWNFMNGANMAVMGYVEESFNITPKAQLIYGREMAYYGTFGKTPAMGWTLVPLSPYKGGADSSFWPYNDKITEYDYMVGLNMLYGVVGSYRGGNGLYQEGPSQNVMETWGEFYNKYRDILGADIVHIAPPIAESYSGLNPSSETTTAVDELFMCLLSQSRKGWQHFLIRQEKL